MCQVCLAFLPVSDAMTDASWHLPSAASATTAAASSAMLLAVVFVDNPTFVMHRLTKRDRPGRAAVTRHAKVCEKRSSAKAGDDKRGFGAESKLDSPD